MLNLSRLVLALICGTWAWAGNKYTKEQINAQFYYDLGPSSIDVSGYPQKQQDNYAVFSRTCSQCHSLARPINAPLVKASDWKRYVLRMHEHTKVRPGTVITKENARRIVEFLAFDAQIRKIKHGADFEARTKQLQEMFQDVRRERSRLQIEEDKRKVKPLPPNGAEEKPRARW